VEPRKEKEATKEQEKKNRNSDSKDALSQRNDRKRRKKKDKVTSGWTETDAGNAPHGISEEVFRMLSEKGGKGEKTTHEGGKTTKKKR